MDRDLKVLELLGKGYTHSMIQKEMSIGKATLSRIRKKHNINVPSQDRKSDMSKLEKLLDKMDKKGFNITKLNYGAIKVYESAAIKPYFGGDENNVLIIGDIHEPVSIEGYLKFCRDQQEKWKCGTVIFIGDIVDFNSFSYHEKIPEELNPYGEVALAKAKLKDWFLTFPKAKVCLGNHDLLPYRKAITAGLLRSMIQSPHEIFGAPSTYEFGEEFIIDNVIYTHGNMGNARNKAPLEGMSIVSGHSHNIAGVQYFRNRHKQIFGMQVGTGIDYTKRNFDYARITPKQPILSCGVILDKGQLPMVVSFTN